MSDCILRSSAPQGLINSNNKAQVISSFCQWYLNKPAFRLWTFGKFYLQWFERSQSHTAWLAACPVQTSAKHSLVSDHSGQCPSYAGTEELSVSRGKTWEVQTVLLLCTGKEGGNRGAPLITWQMRNLVLLSVSLLFGLLRIISSMSPFIFSMTM